MRSDSAAAVLRDRIALTAPGDTGPNALIGTLVPRVLRVGTLALGHDGDPVAVECAEQFAHHAVHGGFAVDGGMTWVRPQIHLHGRILVSELIEAADPGGMAAYFTAADGSGAWLHLYAADGAAVVEASGLGDLRARVATGRPALPVNALCTGMIIDHRQERT